MLIYIKPRFHSMREWMLTKWERTLLLLQGFCFPTLSKETIEEIKKLFKSHQEYQKYSSFFLGQTSSETAEPTPSHNKLRVLCHGNFYRENILFKYKSNLESRLSCCEVSFQDLSRSHYGWDLCSVKYCRNPSPSTVSPVSPKSFRYKVQNLRFNGTGSWLVIKL